MPSATFDIKSANLPLVALLLKSADLQQVARDLHTRFGELPEFFDNDPLVVDLSAVREASLDFAELVRMLRRYKVMPVAVKGGSEKQMGEALLAGLAAADDAGVQGWPPGQARGDKPEPPPPTNALVIDKPLRSGQQVYARGRDLVVLSMVNAGAEVIADGNIHVYAPLRGKAMAGARGNADARILTLCLEAQLLSIAGVYRTSEVALPKQLQGKPAQVRLQGGGEGKLVMEALNS